MGMMSSMGSVGTSSIGATMSNFTSIATADKRARAVRHQYETQAQLANYNRQLAQNQRISEEQAGRYSERLASVRASRQHDANRRLKERQRVLMANSGATFSGTPLLVQQDQLMEMKLQELDIIHEGALAKRQHDINASGFRAQENMFNYQKNMALSIGEYKSDMIQFQKKLTMAKMFYDPANVTSFAEVDNTQQFQHTDTSMVGGSKGGLFSGTGSNIGKSVGAGNEGSATTQSTGVAQNNYYSTGGSSSLQGNWGSIGTSGNQSLYNWGQ